MAKEGCCMSNEKETKEPKKPFTFTKTEDIDSAQLPVLKEIIKEKTKEPVKDE